MITTDPITARKRGGEQGRRRGGERDLHFSHFLGIGFSDRNAQREARSHVLRREGAYNSRRNRLARLYSFIPTGDARFMGRASTTHKFHADYRKRFIAEKVPRISGDFPATNGDAGESASNVGIAKSAIAKSKSLKIRGRTRWSRVNNEARRQELREFIAPSITAAFSTAFISPRISPDRSFRIGDPLIRLIDLRSATAPLVSTVVTMDPSTPQIPLSAYRGFLQLTLPMIAKPPPLSREPIGPRLN